MQLYTGCLLFLYFTSLSVFNKQVGLYNGIKGRNIIVCILLNIFNFGLFFIGGVFLSIWFDLYL